jgi:hypothetical protein
LQQQEKDREERRTEHEQKEREATWFLRQEERERLGSRGKGPYRIKDNLPTVPKKIDEKEEPHSLSEVDSQDYYWS